MNEPEKRRNRGWIWPPLAALLSAALQWAAFFPLNAGWLGWVALVPWLMLVRWPTKSFWTWFWLYLWAWIGAVAWLLPTLSWMGYSYHPAMKVAWIGLTLHCSFFPPITLAFIRALDRAGWPLAVSSAVVIPAMEWVRSWLITGFPWYFLGHTQHDALAVVQICDLSGVYGVSALLAAVNAVLAGWFLAWRAGERRPWRQTAGVAAAFLVVLGYGIWRLGQPMAGEGPVVALLQGDQAQILRNIGGFENEHELLMQYVNRAQRLVLHEKRPPELIVWPETSYPVPWFVPGEGLTPDKTLAGWKKDMEYSQKMTVDLTQRVLARRSSVLLGVSTHVFRPDGETTRHNSAVLIGPDGQFRGRYDKVHCVPFGEYIPWFGELPGMSTMSPIDRRYGLTPGREMTRLPFEACGRTWHLGAVICYEDSDPALAREYVAPGPEPKVDILVNLTDDAWFDGSTEPEQHLAISRFRAIECRRPLVRAVHLGVSAVIDGNGRVVGLPGPTWRASRSTAGEVVMAVPLDDRGSLYAVWGDWPVVACWLAVIGGLMWARVQSPRRFGGDAPGASGLIPPDEVGRGRSVGAIDSQREGTISNG